MLTGNLLLQCKQRMIGILDNYTIDVREQQLATDLQLLNPSLRPDDIKQTLNALKDDGLVTRRMDDMRGPVWKINAEGHKVAASLELES